jgi:hypothetical protein
MIAHPRMSGIAPTSDQVPLRVIRIAATPVPNLEHVVLRLSTPPNGHIRLRGSIGAEEALLQTLVGHLHPVTSRALPVPTD